jgi:hypothetical protein
MPLIADNIRGEPELMMDVIGIGTSPYDLANDVYDRVTPVNFAIGSSSRDVTGLIKFRNLRAEYYWGMRDVLDPAYDLNIMLPPDRDLRAELCAPTYRPTPSGIQIESKKEIKKRLGRSTDRADAVVMANAGGQLGRLGLMDAHRDVLKKPSRWNRGAPQTGSRWRPSDSRPTARGNWRR